MLQAIDCGYVARPHFIPFHKRTQRFSCIVAHRRAGKTVACINDLQDGALRCRRERPRFAYISPYRSQSKTVAWDYLRAAMLPLRALGASANESELRIDYHNGGQVRLYGADNPDALRGIYLDGVVLDEPADMDPRVWSTVISPALADRNGWAVFIGTPKGRNHFYEIYQRSLKEAGWYSLMLKASSSGILPPEELELQRSEKSDEEYRQEFECDFEAAVKGAYYAKAMAQAEQDKRITGVGYEGTAQIWTSWDLGISDQTAIWFAQIVGREIHLIDYYEASGVDLGHYVSVLQSKPYTYAGHIVPHDAQAKELGTGKSRLEVLESLGLKGLRVCPPHRVEDGINAVRVTLPKCWFDAVKCERGIDCLKLYRSDYDEKLQVLKPRPLHDYTSHAADSFRYMCMSLDGLRPKPGWSGPLRYPKLGKI